MDELKVGEYIIYQNGNRYEIGKIKRITEDGAFVYYHEGGTASKTPFDCIHKIINRYTITDTTLGRGNKATINRLHQIFDIAYKLNNDGSGTELSRMCTEFIPDVIQNLQHCIDELKEFGYDIN